MLLQKTQSQSAKLEQHAFKSYAGEAVSAARTPIIVGQRWSTRFKYFAFAANGLTIS